MRFTIVARLFLILVLGMASVTTLAVPAHADRCQPEELLGYDPLIPEEDSPVCDLLIDVVYPIVCEDFTTLANCTTSIDLLGTGELVNLCQEITVVNDGMGRRTVCAGTGGASFSEPGDRQPVFRPIDVATITEQNKVCIPVHDRFLCIGGRDLLDNGAGSGE